MLKSFWAWYEKHYILNVSIAGGLFLLQLVHLYWLTADVVAFRLIGQSFFHLTGIYEILITLVDYTEIPALIATSVVYINEYRKGRKWQALLYLVFLNSQWLHLFWITDEFVVQEFTGTGGGTILPTWLAWVAIGIDYLEIPVIIDTFKKLFAALKARDLKRVKAALKED